MSIQFTLFGVVCLAVFAAAAPSNEVTRAKAIPFGRVVEERRFEAPRVPVFEQREVVAGERSVAARVIPRAPVLDEIVEDRERVVVPVVPVAAQFQRAVRTNVVDVDAEARKQAEAAHYSFATFVDDGIMGHAHARSETRNGLRVDGMYSYSDGFFRRTIQYEADDNGYRIVNEMIEPIGNGPVVDPNGQAVVRSTLGTEYTITAADIRELLPVQRPVA